MVKLSEKNFNYTAAFFMLIALGIGGNILGGVVGIPIIALMSGKDMLFVTENLQQIVGNVAFLREMQVLQSISAIFGFLLPTLFCGIQIKF